MAWAVAERGEVEQGAHLSEPLACGHGAGHVGRAVGSGDDDVDGSLGHRVHPVTRITDTEQDLAVDEFDGCRGGVGYGPAGCELDGLIGEGQEPVVVGGHHDDAAVGGEATQEP